MSGLAPLRSLTAVGALALAGHGLTGCGPIEYISQVTGRASTAVAQAKREGADADAPYEYTAAAAYLDKAREEAARSEYETALEYGRRSEELATRALAMHREKLLRQRPTRALDDGTEPPDRDDEDRR